MSRIEAREVQGILNWISARFGDVSNDADNMARKLISVTSELDSTQGALKVSLQHTFTVC